MILTCKEATPRYSQRSADALISSLEYFEKKNNCRVNSYAPGDGGIAVRYEDASRFTYSTAGAFTMPSIEHAMAHMLRSNYHQDMVVTIVDGHTCLWSPCERIDHFRIKKEGKVYLVYLHPERLDRNRMATHRPILKRIEVQDEDTSEWVETKNPHITGSIQFFIAYEEQLTPGNLFSVPAEVALAMACR